MPDHDQITDSAELRHLRDVLAGLAIPARPPLGRIEARGRAYRRRRVSAFGGLSALAATAAALVAVAVPRVVGGTPAQTTIQTPSYTLVSYQDGTASLTINPDELFDAASLQSGLGREGIPAKVTAGSFCVSDPAPAGLSKAVAFQPAGEWTVQAGTGPQPTITFDPSGIPSGAELSLGSFQLADGQQQADVTLIDSNSFTCSSTPPSGGGPDIIGALYGGPAT